MGDDCESVRLVIRECYVYRIPPRSNARGHRASDWDVSQFLWTGRLRVTSRGDTCSILLEDATTGDLFASCLYSPAENTVEPVLDSSRYFVLRIHDPQSKKHAFVGLGLPDRSCAFDFNVALQDHVNQLKSDKVPPSFAHAVSKDYRLKDGQTISINLGNMPSKKPKPSPQQASSDSYAFLPPSVPSTSFASFNDAYSSTNNNDPFDGSCEGSPGQGADDWADFQDALSSSGKTNSGFSNSSGQQQQQQGWQTF
ncbi:hypothetical protein SeLEV6574_g04973 [Synchytrium endobioticum]|nr:hypothetical protein SeLEV6574_g04973 [Synchytrium endobioticum]